MQITLTLKKAAILNVMLSGNDPFSVQMAPWILSARENTTIIVYRDNLSSYIAYSISK